MTPSVPSLRRLEAATLAMAAALAAGIVGLEPGAPVLTGIVALAVGALVVWIVWQDVTQLTISDSAVLAIAAIAVASRCTQAQLVGEPVERALIASAVDAAVPGALMLAFREIYYRRMGRDGLGLGDVKLAVAGSVLVGTVGFSWALFAASVGALIFVAVRRWRARPFAGADKIAFGAALAPAIWVVWIAQQTSLLVTGT